ncbi:MAG: homoserine dehydrogenase [Leptospira sp.]|nr:homoserine dehydrogenase [Leptospira sp.]
MKKFKLGIIGAGTVGSSLIQMIRNQKKTISEKFGIELSILEIATRTPSKVSGLIDCKISDDWKNVVNNSDVDIVIELVGGTTTAFEIASSCLKNKKTFITANKALISEKGNELFQLSLENKAEIGYEAAVAGAIPIIRTIRNGLGPNDFEYVAGILNGTTNFILTKMEVDGLDYSEALKLAQDLGFAEADPTFDVEGIDVAQKTAILANLAFGRSISMDKVSTRGITEISSHDIQSALEMGYRIKLIGIAKKIGTKLLINVQPVLISLNHPLSAIMNENNAVFYKTNFSGSGMLSGAGAGGNPTASAVLADIIYYANRKEIISANIEFMEKNIFSSAEYASSEDESSRYYLRFTTFDKPGVLSEISRVLGNNGISISSVLQDESIENEPTTVLITTHNTNQVNLAKSLEEIDKNRSIICEKTIAFPIIENL